MTEKIRPVKPPLAFMPSIPAKKPPTNAPIIPSTMVRIQPIAVRTWLDSTRDNTNDKTHDNHINKAHFNSPNFLTCLIFNLFCCLIDWQGLQG